MDYRNARVSGPLSGLRTGLIVALTLIVLGGGCYFGGSIVEGVDANELVVIQYPRGGLAVFKQPGWAPQWFGKVSRYNKRGKIDFTQVEGGADGRLQIQFNDAGRAKIKGSMQYEMPMADDQVLAIHQAYKDMDSLENGLIKPPMSSAVFGTGTLMNSAESYSTKRSMLVQYVEDQTQNGKYQTITANREVDEEMLDANGQPIIRKKSVPEAQIAMKDGQVIRSEPGQLSRFGVRVFGFAIDDIEYDTTVTSQIKEQQSITMAVQTSVANARKAQQDAITAKARGDANVAEARAEQEKIKTVAVVQAEQQRDVAALKAQEAESYKKEQILRAEADAGYKRAIISADNALAQRIEAYKYGVDKLAGALAGHRLTPDIVIGGGGGDGKSSAATAEQIMQLILFSQAKNLGLDLAPKQQ